MEKILKIQNLSKYFNKLKVLSNINLYINEGEIVGLIGPNGAGKSTLLNIIAGILPTDEGRIFFKNQDITNRKTFEICRAGIAKTAQIAKPFDNLTVFQNIYIAARYGGEKNAIDGKEFTEKILMFLNLIHLKDKFANELSVPQRRMVELGKALATEPEILLLDENLAGLTPVEMDNALNLIRKINSNGVSVIIVEHIMQAMKKITDRIIVLNYGNKIAEGQIDEVLKNREVEKAYFGE